MANKTPQFEESQPIFQGVNVASSASGYEEFAKTLGSLAQGAEKVAETVAEDKSNSMYLSSVANIDQLKLSTYENILTDPANASKHVETMRDSIDKVNQISYVNKADRSKLKQYGQKTLDAIELDGIKTSVKQAQIGASLEHFSNWKDQLNVLGQLATSGDEEKFDNYKDKLLEHIKSLVSSGSLTPLQGGNAIQSMSDIVDMKKDVHDVATNIEGHSAQNYHAAMSNPVEPNKTNNIHYPVDENTHWLVKHHSSDRSFQGVLDGIQNHQFDVEGYENLTPHQRNQAKQEMNGIRMADGIIDSNSSLPKINSRIQELEGRTDYASIAERKNLKQYVSDLQNGNSERLMARTTIGGRIVRDYADKQAYLKNQLINTKPENVTEVNRLNNEMAKNKNEYVNNSIGYWQGHHAPVINTIPKEDVAVVENGFNIGDNPVGNAKQALITFNQYSKQNQLYFADQMKNPKQRVVMLSISLGKGNSESDNLNFISANQNIKYKSADPTTGNAITDDYLRNSINTKLTDSIKVIQSQNDPRTAAILNDNLIQAGMNYAHFLAQKNGSFSKKDGSTYNADTYSDNVKQFISNAYQPMSGANYIINKKQNDIEPAQMDALAQYAIDQGHDYMKRGMSESAYIELKNRQPLSVTITPRNNLVARDANGNIAYSHPLGSDLIALANSEVKRAKEEKLKQSQEIFKQGKERRRFLSPEEQFINIIPRAE
jgi:hypothetical protein